MLTPKLIRRCFLKERKGKGKKSSDGLSINIKTRGWNSNQPRKIEEKRTRGKARESREQGGRKKGKKRRIHKN